LDNVLSPSCPMSGGLKTVAGRKLLEKWVKQVEQQVQNRNVRLTISRGGRNVGSIYTDNIS